MKNLTQKYNFSAQLIADGPSPRPFCYMKWQKTPFQTHLPRPPPPVGKASFFTENERVKTFSDRGQKLFYSRSEIFLFAVRKHSVRGQKNLPTKRNRQTSLPIPYPRPTKNSGNTHHKSVRRCYIFLSDNKPFTSHEAH